MERSDSSIKRRDDHLTALRNAFDNEPPYSISFSSNSNLLDDMSEMGTTIHPKANDRAVPSDHQGPSSSTKEGAAIATTTTSNSPKNSPQNNEATNTESETPTAVKPQPQSYPMNTNEIMSTPTQSETPNNNNNNNMKTPYISMRRGSPLAVTMEDEEINEVEPPHSTMSQSMPQPQFPKPQPQAPPIQVQAQFQPQPQAQPQSYPIQKDSAFVQPVSGRINLDDVQHNGPNQNGSARTSTMETKMNVQSEFFPMRTDAAFPQSDGRNNVGAAGIGMGATITTQSQKQVTMENDARPSLMHPMRNDNAFPQPTRINPSTGLGIEEQNNQYHSTMIKTEEEEEEKREIGQDNDHTPLVNKKEEDNVRVNFAPANPPPPSPPPQSLQESLLYEDRPPPPESFRAPEPAPLSSLPSTQPRPTIQTQRFTSQYPQRPISVYQSQYASRRQNNPTRSLWLAALLLVLAGIGLGIGLLVPGNSDQSRSNGIEDLNYNDTDIDTVVVCDPSLPDWINNLRNCTTIDDPPTNSPAVSPNFYDEIYASSFEILISNNISDFGSLSKTCYSPLCVTNKEPPDNMTVQQEALNYLVFEDTITITMLWSGNYNDERFIQRYVLTVLGRSLGISGWDKSIGWRDGSMDECDWFGIECSDRSVSMRDGARNTEELLPMVTRICLVRNSLKGSIPDELIMLRHLEKLELSHNDLSGPIPEGIAALQSLKRIWLQNTTGVTGTIPTEIGNLPQLKSLDLAENRLSGTIPKELGNLADLRMISLYDNRLVGTIPNEITKCTLLMQLFLDKNELTGPLPPTIGALAELRDLRVYQNRLEGMLPSSMAAMKKLRILYLDQNSFSGAIDNHFVSSWVNMVFFSALIFCYTLSW